MKLTVIHNLLKAGLLCLGLAASSVAADKPHIVYILADDMGSGDVSCINPESKIPTIELDKLASEGSLFNDAHSGSSVCTPTRYSIMTGRYSWRTTLKERVLNSYSPCHIPKERDTVASLLKRNGYNTAMIGKWHLGLDWTPKAGKDKVSVEEDVDFTQPITHGPLDLGFDSWYGPAASWDMKPYAFIEGRKMETQDLVQTGKSDLYPRPQEYLDAQTKGAKNKELNSIMKKYPKVVWRPGLMARGMKATDAMPLIINRAVKHINEYNSDKPLFIYMPLTAPHTPVTPSERWRGKSNAGSYGDFVLELDWCVGEVVKALKEKNMFDDTLLIFTADNGASLKAIPAYIIEKYQHNPHHLYDGAKGRVQEGGHRVPFIASWPKGMQKKGGVSNAVISLNDLYATCAELVNETIADNAAEDSVSMLNFLQDSSKTTTDRLLVHHAASGELSIRLGDWKLSDLHKGSKKMSLYNLKEDLGEKNNLFKTKPEKARELQKRLAQIILDGRSTSGAIQKNEGVKIWPQIEWVNTINQ
jgi:arylsulfatase A